jgi:MscS family membrane protein
VLYHIEIVEYEQYIGIKEEINYKIMEIVLANGAKFAFPSRTLYHEFNKKGILLGKIQE